MRKYAVGFQAAPQVTGAELLPKCLTRLRCCRCTLRSEPALGGGEVDEHQDHAQGNECSHVTPAWKLPSHLNPQCLSSRSVE